MAHTDDQWVRLFNVSDPRRAYAGHTLYKVTSKVFQKEFPEGVTEIVVWRRFSDFKKLHQELLKIYSHKHLKEEEFPLFPKAKFFDVIAGRFEDGVIEERRKAALELLTFAGNFADLFTSQPFVKFFEGGFPESPVHGDSVASREGSSSDTEGESPRASTSIQEEKNSERQSPSPPCSSSRENGDNADDASLGGVWLYKQPSLTEGLDNFSSDEEDNDGESTLPVPETEREQTDLSKESSEGVINHYVKDDHDDVFVDDLDECSENETAVSEREERSSSSEPPQWLVRAISICSEGEDLEALASEADTEELSFPQAFSEYEHCSSEERTKENKLSEKQESEFPYNPSSDFSDELHLQQNKTASSEGFSVSKSTSPLKNDKRQRKVMDPGKTLEPVNLAPKYEPSDSSSKPSINSKDSLKDSASVGTAEDKQSFNKSSDSGKAVTRQRTISDLGNIYVHPKESDYLYMAGHTIHKALDCEVNGRYEEAFNLYKTCVGVLLSGVQGEKDAKRREAVRRKTAQYLLKAEALYNTYLAGLESSHNSVKDASPSHSGSSICESDDLQQFKDLTLADLKVMGIVGKVILVENTHNGETYVVKALCKSGPARAHSHSHERRRRKSVRRLYGKYPNIVRLYRYFETASTIYLLLEYARGGRLWDHISCYQRNKESHDYLIRNGNQRNTQGLNKYTRDQSRNDNAANVDADNVNEHSPEAVAKPLTGEDTPLDGRTSNFSANSTQPCSQQVNGDSGEASATLLLPEHKTNNDGIAVPLNDINNKSMSDAKEVREMSKESVGNCSEKTSEVSRDNKHLLFLKLDEYFASSVQRVPDEHIRIWAAEIVLAVAYLHTAGIICRDLHPKNVLLDEEGHVLLTYFGSWEETEHIPDEEAINHFYCAPEISQVDEVTPAADWWSVGALLYEIITGQALLTAHPWGIRPHTELQLPNKVSPEAKSLLREKLALVIRLKGGTVRSVEVKRFDLGTVNFSELLLRVTPSERLGSGVNGVEEIKSHPFFSGVNWAWLCSRIE